MMEVGQRETARPAPRRRRAARWEQLSLDGLLDSVGGLAVCDAPVGSVSFR